MAWFGIGNATSFPVAFDVACDRAHQCCNAYQRSTVHLSTGPGNPILMWVSWLTALHVTGYNPSILSRETAPRSSPGVISVSAAGSIRLRFTSGQATLCWTSVFLDRSTSRRRIDLEGRRFVSRDGRSDLKYQENTNGGSVSGNLQGRSARVRKRKTDPIKYAYCSAQQLLDHCCAGFRGRERRQDKDVLGAVTAYAVIDDLAKPPRAK